MRNFIKFEVGDGNDIQIWFQSRVMLIGSWMQGCRLCCEEELGYEILPDQMN